MLELGIVLLIVIGAILVTTKVNLQKAGIILLIIGLAIAVVKIILENLL